VLWSVVYGFIDEDLPGHVRTPVQLAPLTPTHLGRALANGGDEVEHPDILGVAVEPDVGGGVRLVVDLDVLGANKTKQKEEPNRYHK